jgi:hypothetical protein
MKMYFAGTDKGWILETPKPISQSQFIKIWQYTIKDQKRQIAKMSSGPERKIYEDAFVFLQDMQITHSIKPQGGAN